MGKLRFFERKEFGMIGIKIDLGKLVESLKFLFIKDDDKRRRIVQGYCTHTDLKVIDKGDEPVDGMIEIEIHGTTLYELLSDGTYRCRRCRARTGRTLEQVKHLTEYWAGNYQEWNKSIKKFNRLLQRYKLSDHVRI